jgi:hypothetical protein
MAWFPEGHESVLYIIMQGAHFLHKQRKEGMQKMSRNQSVQLLNLYNSKSQFSQDIGMLKTY